MKVGDWLQVISLILVIASAAIAVISVQKFRNSRGVDYVLNAEGAMDSMHQSLVGQDAALIRNVYSGYSIDDLADIDCQSFPFMYSVYVHLSRLHFLLSAPDLDLGISKSVRQAELRNWMSDMSLYRNHPAMIAVHRTACQSGNFSQSFIVWADRVIGQRDREAQRPDQAR